MNWLTSQSLTADNGRVNPAPPGLSHTDALALCAQLFLRMFVAAIQAVHELRKVDIQPRRLVAC